MITKKRIAIVSPTIPPDNTGNAIEIERTLSLNQKSDFHFAAFLPSQHEELERFSPHLVHLLNLPRCKDILLNSSKPYPLIIAITGTDVFAYWKDFELFAPQISVITVPNKEIKKYFIAKVGLLNTETIIVQKGVIPPQEPDEDSASHMAKTASEKNFTIPLNSVSTQANSKQTIPSAPYIFCAGHIRPVKGIKQLIDCYNSIRQQLDYKIYLAGKVIDQSYFDTIKFQPGDYLGALSRKDLQKHISGSFACLNSSNFEGESNFLKEAMQLSKPIIGKKNPGNSALIKHMRNGYLYKDCKELAEILLSLNNHDQQNPCHNKMGAKNRRFIKLFRSAETENRLMTDLYHRILADCRT